ncbi:hypothetical protein PV10_04275 [Exophiala mesophila]|uniref:Uncharacterized protein n=1 Tax=Exophiala mesophila TaxID=212818 RepID=A0A0D1WUU8_EXOME|nr:uncharacterized protein PV10_04275 [Exophiala mesophila]KIV93030.1 hypothetical protein PV10_04275 [Exophiala mesophila]
MPSTLMMVLASILSLGTMVQPTVAVDTDWLQRPSSTSWTTITIPATLVARNPTNSIHDSHPAKQTSEPSSSPSFGNPVHTPAALATASPPENSLTDKPDGEFMKHVILPLAHPIIPPGVPAAFLDRFYETARRHREKTSHFNPSRQLIPHIEQTSASEHAKAEDKANIRFYKRFLGH